MARRLASMADAAEYLGVTRRTLYTWVHDGRLQAYRLGPMLIRVDLDELDQLLKPIQSDATTNGDGGG